jgi:hypothetical protein
LVESAFVFCVDEEFVEADLCQLWNESPPHDGRPKHEVVLLEVAQIAFRKIALPLVLPPKRVNRLPPAQFHVFLSCGGGKLFPLEPSVHALPDPCDSDHKNAERTGAIPHTNLIHIYAVHAAISGLLVSREGAI